MEDKICDRISKLVMMFGEGKNTAFAARIGDSEANIRNYRSGRTTPKFNVLLSIINNLGVSSEWLMTGKGEIFADGREPELSEAPLRRAVPRGGSFCSSKKWQPDDFYMGVPADLPDLGEPPMSEDEERELERAKKIAKKLSDKYQMAQLEANLKDSQRRIDELSDAVNEIKEMLSSLLAKQK